MPIPARVECYSGYRIDEQPVRFETGGEVLCVVDIIGAWRTPEARFFRVRASDGRVHLLRQSETSGEWTIEP